MTIRSGAVNLTLIFFSEFEKFPRRIVLDRWPYTNYDVLDIIFSYFGGKTLKKVPRLARNKGGPLL